MPGSFSFTKTTNIVVVTNGTAGSPSDFASFVTADRAGSVTLLAAWTPNNNTKALTYQITPVEKLALLISFVVASKTAETDYIFITGTDAWGNAQTESIDVSAGNGTYVTTKRFRTITNIDCSDNAAGGGTVWADGTVAVTQPQWGVIWDYGGGRYQIDANLNVGDGSTSTYFKDTKKIIIFDDVCWLKTYDNATFHLGTKVSSISGKDGGFLGWRHQSTTTLGWGSQWSWVGITLLYGVKIADIGSNAPEKNPWINIYKSSSELISLQVDGLPCICVRAAFYIYNLTLLNCLYGLDLKTAANINQIIINNSTYCGFLFDTPSAGLVVKNIIARNSTTYDLYTKQTWNDAYIINATYETIFTPTGGTKSFYIQYTCNIHISDKDGTNLSGVAVLCTDKDNNTIFNINTDANGDITEQTITYRRYYNGGYETLSPHKFTISKAGYETLVLDAITVDKPIVWHLELLPILAETDVRLAMAYGESKTGALDLPSVNDVEKGVQFDGLTKTGTFKRPPQADVRLGEQYGANDIEFTGLLDLPAIANVRDGIFFDGLTKEGILDLPSVNDVEKGVKFDNLTKTGTFKSPAETDVREGEGYGANDIEFEGDLDLPNEEDVEEGVQYDGLTKTGRFHVPAEEDVEVGVGYGADGTEFLGEYLGLRGDNLTAELEKSVDLVGYLENKVELTGELRS